MKTCGFFRSKFGHYQTYIPSCDHLRLPHLGQSSHGPASRCAESHSLRWSSTKAPFGGEWWMCEDVPPGPSAGWSGNMLFLATAAVWYFLWTLRWSNMAMEDHPFTDIYMFLKIIFTFECSVGRDFLGHVWFSGGVTFLSRPRVVRTRWDCFKIWYGIPIPWLKFQNFMFTTLSHLY